LQRQHCSLVIWIAYHRAAGKVTLLIRYRRNTNPAVRTYIINLQPYQHFITPQDEACVTYISGWSEGVLRYVALDTFDLVEEIERISLDAQASS